jgi:hypothetical protein
MSDGYEELCGDQARLSRFVVGQDGDGHWVVWDRLALCGGSFVNRGDAVRYARFESEGSAGQVTLSSDVVRFEVTPRRLRGSHDSLTENNEPSNDEQAADALGRRKAA